MARSARPYAIPAVKPKGTFRIFIIGESAAYGDPDPTYAFGRYLEVMLRERFPGTHFEVINTGITAINSHMLAPIAEDSARHQPDLFIVYAGNNEVVGPYGPGNGAISASLSLPIIRTNIFMRSTRTGQLVTKILKPKKQGWRGMETFNQQVRNNSPAMEHVYHNFARNLQDIVSVARGSGARVVLCTVATNLKDSAPFGSLHREGLSQESLRSWSALVDEGAARESAGDWAQALQLYQSAAKTDDQYADLQFRIARCMWNLQDYAGAKQHFILARDYDTLRFRTDSRENGIIRSLAAASGQGVELLDLSEIFDRESPHGITGGELLYEHVHMNPEGNYLIARNLFPMIVRALPSQVRNVASGDEIPSEAECERMLALTRFDRSRVAKLILHKFERPPFTTQLNYSEELQRTSALAEPPNENWDDISAQYLWAIAKHPDDRLLHLNYAFLLYQVDPDAATEEFRKAMPYDNAPVLCNWRTLR